MDTVYIRAVNGYPGSKISARVGTVGPPVVINTDWLAKISAAMKSCTPRVVVALLSATEASHLSGRQGADEVGRPRWVCGLDAWVTACIAAAAAGRDCSRPADLSLPPLTAVAAEFRLTSLTS